MTKPQPTRLPDAPLPGESPEEVAAALRRPPRAEWLALTTTGPRVAALAATPDARHVLLLLVLLMLPNDTGSCTVSVPDLTQATGLTNLRVRNALHLLRKKAAIIRERTPFKKSRYYLNAEEFTAAAAAANALPIGTKRTSNTHPEERKPRVAGG